MLLSDTLTFTFSFTAFSVCYPVLGSDEVTSFISSLAKCYNEKRKSIIVFLKAMVSVWY